MSTQLPFNQLPEVMRFMTSMNPEYQVEIGPGMYKRVHAPSGAPELYVTLDGLRHLRAIEALPPAFDRVTDALKALDTANARVRLVDHVLRVCAGQIRRQGRVNR